MRYWIGVASKEHVLKGVHDGVMQLGHGKRGPLARLDKDDRVFYYSPIKTFESKEPLQAFTALGQVTDDEIYKYKVSDDFEPFRRRVSYTKVKDVPIRPLIDDLEFIANKQAWGYAFRYGLAEISEKDFRLIEQKMVRLL
jgi:predicted RNA-binding protein